MKIAYSDDIYQRSIDVPAVAPCHEHMTAAALIPRKLCCPTGPFHGQGAWTARVLRTGCIGRSVRDGRFKLGQLHIIYRKVLRELNVLCLDVTA